MLTGLSGAQVDGFPPKDVVKTVFVEHDIQGDLGELNLVDYVQVRACWTSRFIGEKNKTAQREQCFSRIASARHLDGRLCAAAR